jgi:hypothetical protein
VAGCRAPSELGPPLRNELLPGRLQGVGRNCWPAPHGRVRMFSSRRVIMCELCLAYCGYRDSVALLAAALNRSTGARHHQHMTPACKPLRPSPPSSLLPSTHLRVLSGARELPVTSATETSAFCRTLAPAVQRTGGCEPGSNRHLIEPHPSKLPVDSIRGIVTRSDVSTFLSLTVMVPHWQRLLARLKVPLTTS